MLKFDTGVGFRYLNPTYYLALAREEFPLAVFIPASQRLGLETLRQRLSLLIQYAVDGG